VKDAHAKRRVRRPLAVFLVDPVANKFPYVTIWVRAGNGHPRGRAMLQFAGTTVDGEASAVYTPLVDSPVRY
jgi:hypothetical protein